MEKCQITIIENGNQSSPYQVYSDSEKDLIGVGLESSEFDPNDPSNNIELNVYNNNGDLVYNDPNFINYDVTNDPNTKGGISTLNLSPGEILAGLGFSAGLFTTVLRFNKNQLGSSFSNPLFFTQEISPNRQEIRVNSTTISEQELITSSTFFSSSLASDDNNFDDFYINFGEDQQYIANNILIQDSSFLVHLYEPLPEEIGLNSPFYIVTQPADPLNLQVDLPVSNQLDSLELTPPPFLKGPNLNLDIKDTTNNSTEYQTLNDLINLPLTSSYNQLQNILNQKGININLDYTKFEEFIHFSSAKDRLNNFYYKASLIESASGQISLLSNNSPTVSSSKFELENYITNIVKNFDGFENYLYFESTSFSWPKSNSIYPYELYGTGSTQVLEWLGSDIPSHPYFGGQISLANEYDINNVNALVKAIPEYLREDPANLPYDLFISMIGQHFDNLYFYTKDITNRFDGDNRLNFGISKDLVGEAIKSFGINLYQNNFSSDDLYSSFLGISKDGTNLPPTGSEKILHYITGSQGLESLNDVNKATYKRIYHNLPYLLKKKGTIEGLKALLSCFGVPDTVLKISEFGGKDKINTNDWDYFYRKYSKAVNSNNGVDRAYIKTPWLPLYAAQIEDQEFRVPETVQFRFKADGIPDKNHYSQSLWTLSTGHHNLDTKNDFNVGLFLYYTGDQEQNGVTPDHSGFKTPIDNQSGALQLVISGAGEYIESGLIELPFFNDDWWSVTINRGQELTLDNLSLQCAYTLHAQNKLYNGGDGSKIGYQRSTSINNGPLRESLNRAWADWDEKSATVTNELFTNIPPTAYQPYAGMGSRFGFGGKKKKGSNTRVYVNDEIYFSGSIQEIRYYSRKASQNTIDDYTMNPESIEGDSPKGDTISLSPQTSYNKLNFRAASGNELLIANNNISGSNDLGVSSNFLLYNSIHPSITGSSNLLVTESFVICKSIDNPSQFTYPTQSVYLIRDDQEIGGDYGPFIHNFRETYYVDQPLAGIKNRITDKIRVGDNTITDNVLSNNISIEQNYIASSSYTKDINYLEVGFSPQNEINDDINATYGYLNLGEYIGDPRLISSSQNSYPELDKLRNQYFAKYFKPYSVKDYIRLIKYFDNSLFKMIKDFTPARTSLSSGVIIKQHLLERNRYPQPLVSSSEEDYTGSINTAFIKGGGGGSINNLAGRLEDAPEGSYLQYLSSSEEFSQSWGETFVGPNNISSIQRDEQYEFYNGEFSGSTLNIQLDSNNPYINKKSTHFNYDPYLFSAAGNRHIEDLTFLSDIVIPDEGEVFLYYITSSIIVNEDLNDDNTSDFSAG